MRIAATALLASAEYRFAELWSYLCESGRIVREPAISGSRPALLVCNVVILATWSQLANQLDNEGSNLWFAEWESFGIEGVVVALVVVRFVA